MITVKICVGTNCHLNGGYNVISSFQHMIEEYDLHDKVVLEASFCMRECSNSGAAVTVNDVKYRVDPERSRLFFKEKVLPLTIS
ncbi:MAG: (2Fe-2S) ferredoxin domain-containing protein [Clostridia bacterium]|nr:(2Fe-2S) ferredoxin domain-containing protein [Clostridia bacterium]